MKIRGAGKKPEKVESQMVPMIDVVFQLLIFFMLTLKVSTVEGDFSITMPLGQSSSTEVPPETKTLRVRLEAADDGKLKTIRYNDVSLAVTYKDIDDKPENDNDEETAFTQLNHNVRRDVDFRNGKPNTDDVEVEIEADYNLNYQYTLRAVSACTGTMMTAADGQPRLFRYVEKIKFAPPKPPGSNP
jgi:biopolymer transport protein ExbD